MMIKSTGSLVDETTSGDDRSQESMNDLNSQSTQDEANELHWKENSSSRIGENYQVSFLPSADTFKSGPTKECPDPEQTWDPVAARKEKADNFILNYIAPNIKEFAIELLHKKNYNANGFMRDLEEISPLDGSDWSIDEHDAFRQAMLESKHDIVAASKATGKSIANCLTVYYRIINVRETRSSRNRRDASRIMSREMEMKYDRHIDGSLMLQKQKKKRRSSQDRNETATSANAKLVEEKTSRIHENITAATAGDPPLNVEKESTPNKSEDENKRNKSKRNNRSKKRSPVSLTSEESIEPSSSLEATPSDPPSESTMETEQKKVQDASPKSPQMEKNEIETSIISATVKLRSKSINNTGIAARRTRRKTRHDKFPDPATNEDDETENKNVAAPASRYNTRRTRASTKGSTLYSDEVLAKRIQADINAQAKPRQTPARSQGVPDKPKQVRSQKVVESAIGTRRSTRLNHTSDSLEPKTVKYEKDDHFEEKFQMLLDYKKEYGHCYVPKVYKENQTLSYWVFRLRAMYKEKANGKTNRLTQERIDRLKKVGFVFWAKNSKQQRELESLRRRPKDEAKWKQFIALLKEYKEEFGNCLVPKVYPVNQPLSTWVFGQRQQKRNYDNPDKESRLTAEKIQELVDIGFVWKAKRDKEWQEEDRHRKIAMVEEAWQGHFTDLIAFKKKTGHTRVPKCYPKNQSLSSWVFRQRAMYKKLLAGDLHGLTPTRLKQLESVKFEFRVKFNSSNEPSEKKPSMVTRTKRKAETNAPAPEVKSSIDDSSLVEKSRSERARRRSTESNSTDIHATATIARRRSTGSTSTNINTKATVASSRQERASKRLGEIPNKALAPNSIRKEVRALLASSQKLENKRQRIDTTNAILTLDKSGMSDIDSPPKGTPREGPTQTSESENTLVIEKMPTEDDENKSKNKRQRIDTTNAILKSDKSRTVDADSPPTQTSESENTLVIEKMPTEDDENKSKNKRQRIDTTNAILKSDKSGTADIDSLPKGTPREGPTQTSESENTLVIEKMPTEDDENKSKNKRQRIGTTNAILKSDKSGTADADSLPKGTPREGPTQTSESENTLVIEKMPTEDGESHLNQDLTDASTKSAEQPQLNEHTSSENNDTFPGRKSSTCSNLSTDGVNENSDFKTVLTGNKSAQEENKRCESSKISLTRAATQDNIDNNNPQGTSSYITPQMPEVDVKSLIQRVRKLQH